MCIPKCSECENEEILKFHLTAEEPQWDPSTSEYSERVLDHKGQISIPTTVVT